MSSQSNITLILSPTCTTKHILYTTVTLDWYTYRIWPYSYTVTLFVIHHHILHHRHNRTHTVYKCDLTLVHLQTMTIHSYSLIVILFVIHNHILHHRHNRTHTVYKCDLTQTVDTLTRLYSIWPYTVTICNSQPHPAPQT